MTKEEWWENYDSWTLCWKYDDKFDEWWDPEKFNWEDSWALSRYCAENFDTWWDPDKFNWYNSSNALALYCNNHFNKWWDGDKYNWIYVKDLREQCYFKFTQLQLKQLAFHPNKTARKFAINELRRWDDEGRMVGEV